MNYERLHKFVTEKQFPDESERNLADLMFCHLELIDRRLGSENIPIEDPIFAMDWREIVVKGEPVMVIAGLLPAKTKDGEQIKEILATPTVFCIPKKRFGDTAGMIFDKNNHDPNLASSREAVISSILSNPDTKKFYNYPGWGANPYVFSLPMADLAVEYDGVAVLSGLMGSMRTTKKDRSPRDFAKQGKYGWGDILDQAIGNMYFIEGKEAFKFNGIENDFRRVIVGHSMQGRTILRMLAERIDDLPNSFFIPITPLLAGGGKKASAKAKELPYFQSVKRFVTLGYDIPGKLMQAELAILGNLKAETRERILLLFLPLVRLIVGGYTRPSEPYGEELLVLAHLLEYTENPWAVSRQTELLDKSEPALKQPSMRRVGGLFDKFMLVYAGKDRVLPSFNLYVMAAALSSSLHEGISVISGKLVYIGNGSGKLSMVSFNDDNHYLRRESWDRINAKLSSKLN